MARSWDEDETGGDGTVTGAQEEGRSLHFQCWPASHGWVWNQLVYLSLNTAES